MTFIIPERDGLAQARAGDSQRHSQIFTERHLDQIPELARLGEERLLEMRVVSSVLFGEELQAPLSAWDAKTCINDDIDAPYRQ